MSSVDKILIGVQYGFIGNKKDAVAPIRDGTVALGRRQEAKAALLALLEAEAVDVVPVDLTLNDRFKAISLERVRELFGE